MPWLSVFMQPAVQLIEATLEFLSAILSSAGASFGHLSAGRCAAELRVTEAASGIIRLITALPSKP